MSTSDRSTDYMLDGSTVEISDNTTGASLKYLTPICGAGKSKEIQAIEDICGNNAKLKKKIDIERVKSYKDVVRCVILQNITDRKGLNRLLLKKRK